VKRSRKKVFPRWTSLLLLAAMLDVLLVPAPASMVSAQASTYYGLIVGVADYPGFINDLRFTDDDAREVRDALLRYANWEADNVQLLIDSAATKSAIQAAIEQIGAVAGQDDVVLFFFSGHGTTGMDVAPLDEEDGVDEYIVPYGSTISQYIRDDELSEWLGNLPTANVVVILDTCHSGGQIKAEGTAIKSLAGTPADLVQKGDGFAADITARVGPRDMDDNPGCVVLTAADDDEYSYELAFLRNGVFSYFVIRALEQDPDRDDNGELSAEEIFVFSWARTFWLSRRLHLGQHPQIYDGYPAGAPSTGQLAVGIGSPPG